MMDGYSGSGAIQPLSSLKSIEPVLARTATDERPTPAEEGESGSFDSQGKRGDSADLSQEGAALAAAEVSEAATGGSEPMGNDTPPTGERIESIDRQTREAPELSAHELQEGRTPGETIENMERVRREALAPPNPSHDDLLVAAEAERIADQARNERLTQSREALREIHEDEETRGPEESSGSSARAEGRASSSNAERGPETSGSVDPRVRDALEGYSSGTAPENSGGRERNDDGSVSMLA